MFHTRRTAFVFMLLLYNQEIGHNAITVVGVVVVEVAVGVDIPEVRGVAEIRRTQPPISRTQMVLEGILYISLRPPLVALLNGLKQAKGLIE